VQSQKRLFTACAAAQHYCKQHAQGFRPCVCATVLVKAADRVSVQSQKRLFTAWAAEQHWCKQHAQGFRPCVCATVLNKAADRVSVQSKKGCLKLGLQNSTGASSMHRGSGLVSVQHCWSKLQNLIGVCPVPIKTVYSLGCSSALLQAACTGVQALCLCNSVGQSCR